ncbi:hypothetical protein BYT27DRAFT_7216821 [Phlegmacium glaucopus]|nr:hypothetical protein BYT27DRAFT_7216821 [Phlegmacium glaucopus]
MPDWKSTTELQQEAAIFSKFMHALLGLYAYEFLLSLDFDWEFLSGKKRFRWPLIFYFANRYLLLVALIGVRINCQALYTFNQLAGDAAVGLASINLSIRTTAIWAQNKYIIGLLVLIILGHWSLILQGVQLKATWVDGVGCVITKTNNTVLAAIFIYSMCFDLIVLLLNTYKLVRLNSHAPASQMYGRSRLVHMMVADGLVYFLIAFLANLVATIFMMLNLNQIMSVIFNVPAAIASTVAACRVVRRLTNFNNTVESFGPSSSHNPVAASVVNGRPVPTANYINHARSGVHVQMETFTHAESPMDDVYEKSKSGSDTDLETDLEAKGEL